MDQDRLHWIYSATDPGELRQRYDEWAASYDVDLDAMEWLAPRAGAERCHAWAGPSSRVLDAGCGTGQVGRVLRELGISHLVGIDLSDEMLARSAATGAYDELFQGSLLESLPFAGRPFDAAVSVGVFTHAHVGPAAFGVLTRAVRSGGHVTVTFRDDVVSPLGYQAEADRLERAGVWALVERTDPAPLIVEEGAGVDMRVWTWRVM